MGVANNFGCFFLSGLPGGIDYVLLVLVRALSFLWFRVSHLGFDASTGQGGAVAPCEREILDGYDQPLAARPADVHVGPLFRPASELVFAID